jgi:NAD-dependent SIR2 family protein deacetylase
VGVIKEEDVMAWGDGERVLCVECGNPAKHKPLTRYDFAAKNFVKCDECGEWIKRIY